VRAHMLRLARRRGRPSRGQALVEFATFFVFIMFLLAGVIDTAGLLDDHVNIVYAARQGARTAAVMGKNLTADCAVIGAVNAAMATMPNVQVTRIVIYPAGATGAPLDPTNEMVYPGSATCTANSSGTFAPSQPCTTCKYTWDTRTNTAYNEDSIAVEVDYTYTFRLSFFDPFNNATFQASDRAVMPISPVSIPTPGSGGSATPTSAPTSAPTPTPTPTCLPSPPGGPIIC
jgi:Flp pilus assembly protein TadG